MVRRAYAQRSVFEVLLPDGDKLWDFLQVRVVEALEPAPFAKRTTATPRSA